MKRTMSLVILPGFFQFDIATDNFNNIQPVFNFVNWSHKVILVKILISVKNKKSSFRFQPNELGQKTLDDFEIPIVDKHTYFPPF